ncbi:ABC transporter substrate-binding protein [Actibacterium sp. XHP0104]|nr:ABC transporter substrate-binding protein [Actibacterium sp. XHP0104]MCV2881489.1 ABC transporter substrate-binding protein [Actibacterium sp. XHP0104]
MLIAALSILLGAALPASAAPKRVVSLNVCTDQLAMMLAEPGQLVSVSFLARDPRSSAMADQAQAYPVNHGLAEEVFELQPDLVLAGTYSSRGAVMMLRRLGIEVIEFPPENGLDGVRRNLTRMGQALGQETRAAALLTAFETDLAALRADPPRRPRVALYGPNGYTTGDDTLAGAILATAGFDNIAAEAGLPGGGTLPLEQLVMLQPDLIITGTRYEGSSRAEALLDHPALTDLAAMPRVRATGGAWVCGTPHLLDAVREMVDLRREMETGQ